MIGRRVIGNILWKKPIKDKKSKNDTDDTWYTYELAMQDYMDYGYITCPNCLSPLEADAARCGQCGWQNRHQI